MTVDVEYRPLSGPGDFHRVEQLAMEGLSKTRAAARLGVSFDSLSEWLELHGRDDWFPPIHQWKIDELVFLADSGERLVDVAHRLGMKNEEAARRLLRKHNPRVLEIYDRRQP